MLSGSSPSGLPCMSNHTAPNLLAHEVGLGCKEHLCVEGEPQIIQTTVKENRQAGTEACSHSLTFPAVEEGRGKKSLLGQELLSSKQGKMNSLLESSRTFLNPHLRRVLGLLLSVPTSSARPFKEALAARTGETPTKDALPRESHPCPPQPRDLSGSGRRERSLRSSDRRKPVP